MVLHNKTMRVPYALAVYGKEEVDAVVDTLKNPSKITAGEKTKKFERRIAKLFGKKYGVMVNSGSSANLLALTLLNLPKGSEIITPALTFATTVAPIVQLGLTPVFVDGKPDTYQIDADRIEEAVTTRTRAIMVPSLIGNIPDLKKIHAIAKKHKLFFIEDSCDTLGATLKGEPTGAFSDITTTSFYASHIITGAGGGGMLCMNDSAWLKRAIVLREWGRESSLFGAHEKSENIEKRFDERFRARLGGIPYDAKFIFSEIGYNMQPLELSAAFALSQLTKLKKFTAIRRRNFAALTAYFRTYGQFFLLPKQQETVKTSWLAYPLTIKKNAPFTRWEIVTYLERNNIQTRPVFTGNITKQPGFKKLEPVSKTGRRWSRGMFEREAGSKDEEYSRYYEEEIALRSRKYPRAARMRSEKLFLRRVPARARAGSKYPVADAIMENSFLIGCHHGLTEAHIDYLKKTFTAFLNQLT